MVTRPAIHQSMALLTCLQPVAIGGVFLIQQGKAKLHVMVCVLVLQPHFSPRSQTLLRSRC